ncbi:hypothetical protein Hanom_Chr08g00741831 [Helianthus anomalus]
MVSTSLLLANLQAMFFPDMLIILVKTSNWSLFDFVDPPRNASLRSANRVAGEQDASVLKIHIENFLLPVVIVDSSAQLVSPPPSGGSEASLGGAKKIYRIRLTGKKSATIEATASPVATGVLMAPEGAVVTSAPAIISPHPLLNRHTLTRAQTNGGPSIPLTSGEISTSAIGGQSVPLAEHISQASVLPVSSLMPPPLFRSH